MSQRYRQIQQQLFTRTRSHFGLSDSEAWLILDDAVLNLEAMAADLAPREGVQVDLAKSPQRIMQALGTLADQLECAVLAEIVADLIETGVLDGGPLPAHALEPLTHFVQGLRHAMPPISRGHGNWPASGASGGAGRASELSRET